MQQRFTKKYRESSLAVLKENPYRIAEEIWGIGFKTADTIAQNLGFEKHSNFRIQAGILHYISTMISFGSLYSEVSELKIKVLDLLELGIEHANRVKNALHVLYDRQKIVLVSTEDKNFIALAQHYYIEHGVSQKIDLILSRPSRHHFDHNLELREQQSIPEHVKLSEQQKDGIAACLQNKITVITGGPGTGKTTLIRTLIKILGNNGVRYKLTAPTGRAAKRMMESTRQNAITIHRLLEFDFANMNFKHNEQNALKLDFLIVDEASMIDIFLASSLLKALPNDAHLVLIGDVNQLPPVGAGNFLHDVIDSKIVKCIELDHIFRQTRGSLIVINAHKINKGEFPSSGVPGAKKDFVFIREDEAGKVNQHLKFIHTKYLKSVGISQENSIVLSPMKRGVAGTNQLNQDLQNIINPSRSEKEIARFATTMKIGDRVMQIRNNYEKCVFNGDIGSIEDIDTEAKSCIVKYIDRPVEYAFEELDELVLAYAISVHKSQGSEYDAVIIPLFMQHFTLLQRNLLYTAVTRAKKLCIVIGQPKAVAIAIKNNRGIDRTTFLKQFLTTDLQCR